MGIVTWIRDIGSGRVTGHVDIAPMRGPPAGSLAGTFDAWLRLVHSDAARAARDRRIACLKGQRPVDRAVERLLHADGGLRWFESCGRGVDGPDGRAWQLLGVVREITEQKLAAQSLAVRKLLPALDNALNQIVANDLLAGVAAVDVTPAHVGARQRAAMDASAEDAGLGAPR